MAEIKWSSEQRKVIDSREKNLLVSAAAGAGKTTVLVERILGLIAEEDTDIDRLLVVTFTKDAAAQMREKIGDRIEEILLREPDNRRMLRQQMLLRNASIMTIDSFCNSVVKEYFHEIDIDPAFRIGQDAELNLLQSNVLADLIEEYYEIGSEDFITLVESFCNSGSDKALDDMILRLAGAAQAQAWPLEWLDRLEEEFTEELAGGAGISPEWEVYLTEYAHIMVGDALRKMRRAEAICLMTNGPQLYLDTVRADRNIAESILEANSYTELYSIFLNCSFSRIPTKKQDCDEDLKDKFKELRDEYKGIIKDDIGKSFFSKSSEEICEELKLSAGPVITLIRITREFIVRFGATKKERNILDFGDLEHFTLDILAQKNSDGSVTPRPAAIELHERFREIFIDEYQDSNFVQEQIMEIIAGKSSEHPYTFMVGDVKQSIYKFRMAKPELFMHRFADYREHPDHGEVISLGRNFRSRPEVLDSTNDVFYVSMQAGVGGVTYDDEAALVCGQRELAGGNMPSTEEHRTEVILLSDTDNEEESGSGATARRMLEASYAAKRVRRLIDSGYIIAEGTDKAHRIGYGDIVILLRSLKEWAEIYTEAFENEGIPIFSDNGVGFLNSYEITAMLNYLRILDNPGQDIPLAAVMKSAIGGFTADELVEIRAFGGTKTAYWEALRTYAAEGNDSGLKAKTENFLRIYNEIQGMNLSRDIDRVIAAVYDKTDFYLYCSALPGGDRRASNLDLLMSYAAEYEASSFSGLFSFVRYLEQILKSEQDLEEAVNAEAGDAVRIMSIHKSKGLEFPVVIIGGMGRKISNMDAKQSVIISSDFGIAAPCVDLKLRTKTKTLRREIFTLMMKLDNLGEELRLLYVAMTRAKQKLIMIGAMKDAGKCIDEWEMISNDSADVYPVSYIASATSYFDFVYPVALRKPQDFALLLADDLKKSEEEGTDSERDRLDEIKQIYKNIDAPISSEIRELMNYVYPYAGEEKLPVKLSVSELKHAGMEKEGETAAWVTAGPSQGAARGTVYHLVMQFLPFELRSFEEVNTFLDSMVKSDIIDEDERSMINAKDIVAFLNTELAARLQEADRSRHLRREQPFVLGRKACDIDPEKYAGMQDIIPVQGIIDCMFGENGRYTILDYKTDHVGPGQEEVLVKRYRAQLQNYAEAVSHIIGAPVDKCLIYSFALGEVIDV